MSEYFIATTKASLSKTAAAKLNEKLHNIGSDIEFVGPINIPGNFLHGWIVRPDDGRNYWPDQKARNQQAASLLIEAAEQELTHMTLQQKGQEKK